MMHAVGHEIAPIGRLGPRTPAQAFPITKLRGLTAPIRAALKRQRITTCEQLLRAAGRAEDRTKLARQTRIDPPALLPLVQQADLARVDGIGTVFGMMLEELGVGDVATLAGQEPEHLHAQLRRYNREERLARRSPTPEEVESWVEQARKLPPLIGY